MTIVTFRELLPTVQKRILIRNVAVIYLMRNAALSNQ